ncbi:SigE family RNA polymerase sigma factor [Herbidospora sp. NEAU-GS84]|uniref:SigE family RNA polymerase sigma factor n=1 Tax=Herbidospora solisilvae TaxID=2696284 RepID=A0A7C9NLZ7_9ACTN|nr:SigE family RNA polymerase sigma factor [Herbidospora solisilvae]NAS26658.1 SigE family RNA polymerase sigma factor [Herbidospora solisilvae]
MDSAAELRFREFVAARSPALMGLAYLLTAGDQHAAEDLVQSSLVRALGRWSGVTDPEAYVRRVMYHQHVSLWRRAWRRHETTVAELPETGGDDGTRTVELRLALREALATLTRRQRAMLVLRYYEDLPEEEIARLMGCSIGTVRSTTHRSLAKLRSADLRELTR